MLVKCKKCGYEWNTKSKLLMVSCPSCGTKNKIKHQSGLKNFHIEDVSDTSGNQTGGKNVDR